MKVVLLQEILCKVLFFSLKRKLAIDKISNVLNFLTNRAMETMTKEK